MTVHVPMGKTRPVLLTTKICNLKVSRSKKTVLPFCRPSDTRSPTACTLDSWKQDKCVTIHLNFSKTETIHFWPHIVKAKCVWATCLQFFKLTLAFNFRRISSPVLFFLAKSSKYVHCTAQFNNKVDISTFIEHSAL